MRIGIYNEPPHGSIGGSEFLSSVLASALSADHDVDLIHHLIDLEKSKLEQFFALDLSKVALKHARRDPMAAGGSRLKMLIGGHGRTWRSELSSGYDRFVAVCHSIPPYCHAKSGVLVVLFPLYRPAAEWPWNDPPRHALDLWRLARGAFYKREWQRRLASYDAVVSISKFTQQWTRKWWGIDSDVVYPPVSMESPAVAKQNLLVSVGRFTPSGHAKRHREMMETFAKSAALRAAGWTYQLLGSLTDMAADRQYFSDLERLAAEIPGVSLLANRPRGDILAAYASAKVFVHAAGFGLNEDDRPDLSEHFGIATVEAMAAGCVPVVIGRGAQAEIVEHEVSGFVWHTLEELQAYLQTLATDEALRERMSANARRRAMSFSSDRFLAQMRPLILGAQNGTQGKKR